MFKPYKSDFSDRYGFPDRNSDAFFYMGGYKTFGYPCTSMINPNWLFIWEPMSRAEAIKEMSYFPRFNSMSDTMVYVYDSSLNSYPFIHSSNKNAVKIDGRRQRPRPIQLYVNWHEEDTGFQIMLDKAMEGPKPYEGPTKAGFGNRKLKKLAGSTCGLFSASEMDFMRKWVDYIVGDVDMQEGNYRRPYQENLCRTILEDTHIGHRKIQNHSAFGSMGKPHINMVHSALHTAYSALLEDELTERVRSGAYSGVHSPWPAFEFDRPTLPIHREAAMVSGSPLGYAKLIYQAIGNNRGSTILFPRKDKEE
jgi:hypothetical protein